MDLSPNQASRYIRELEEVRNERLDSAFAGEVNYETIVADAMNALEVFYIVQRAIVELEDEKQTA